MSETAKTPFEPFFEEIRRIIQEEIRVLKAELNGQGNPKHHKSYLTVKEAADLARLGPSTIRLYIRKRQLKAFQVGRRVIIRRADLERFLEAYSIEALPD